MKHGAIKSQLLQINFCHQHSQHGKSVFKGGGGRFSGLNPKNCLDFLRNEGKEVERKKIKRDGVELRFFWKVFEIFTGRVERFSGWVETFSGRITIFQEGLKFLIGVKKF